MRTCLGWWLLEQATTLVYARRLICLTPYVLFIPWNTTELSDSTPYYRSTPYLLILSDSTTVFVNPDAASLKSLISFGGRQRLCCLDLCTCYFTFRAILSSNVQQLIIYCNVYCTSPMMAIQLSFCDSMQSF